MKMHETMYIIGVVAGILTLLLCLTEFEIAKYAMSLVSICAFAISDSAIAKDIIKRNNLK